MTQRDVLLSLGRWVSYVLLEPWTITIGEARESAVDERPVAVIEPTAPASRVNTGLNGPRSNGRILPVSVAAYPARGADPMRAILEAGDVADALDSALQDGLFGDDHAMLAPAGQLPIWDYEGVDLTGPGPVLPSARMDIIEPRVRVIQDAEDVRLASVQLTLSVRWWVLTGGRSIPDLSAPAVTAVPGGPGDFS